MVLSRSILIGKLQIYIAKNFNLKIDELRLWSLEINGKACRQMLTDNSVTLYDLGILSGAQVFYFVIYAICVLFNF